MPGRCLVPVQRTAARYLFGQLGRRVGHHRFGRGFESAKLVAPGEAGSRFDWRAHRSGRWSNRRIGNSEREPARHAIGRIVRTLPGNKRSPRGYRSSRGRGAATLCGCSTWFVPVGHNSGQNRRDRGCRNRHFECGLRYERTRSLTKKKRFEEDERAAFSKSGRSRARVAVSRSERSTFWRVDVQMMAVLAAYSPALLLNGCLLLGMPLRLSVVMALVAKHRLMTGGGFVLRAGRIVGWRGGDLLHAA